MLESNQRPSPYMGAVQTNYTPPQISEPPLIQNLRAPPDKTFQISKNSQTINSAMDEINSLLPHLDHMDHIDDHLVEPQVHFQVYVWPMCAFLVVVGIFGCVGNVMVIMANKSQKSLRNTLVLMLAITDLFCCANFVWLPAVVLKPWMVDQRTCMLIMMPLISCLNASTVLTLLTGEIN